MHISYTCFFVLNDCLLVLFARYNRSYNLLILFSHQLYHYSLLIITALYPARKVFFGNKISPLHTPSIPENLCSVFENRHSLCAFCGSRLFLSAPQSLSIIIKFSREEFAYLAQTQPSRMGVVVHL